MGKSEVSAGAYFAYLEILGFYKVEGCDEASGCILNWIIDASELNMPAFNKAAAATAAWLFEMPSHSSAIFRTARRRAKTGP
ncbi:MAG: hypothetical protein LBU32_04065 [Clostridiales bacterium]|nr:hypothetical protein [Clostridiales bacterium]